MRISILQAAGALGVVMATTAALPTCNKDGGEQPASQSAPAAAAATPASAAPGLPADFPIAPGLSPCNPRDAGGEIICEWHNVDGHAIYKFYLEALPKAGYTVLPGMKQVPPPDYKGPLGLGFRKGSAQGGLTIASGTLTIQYLPHQ
jgi:hypothetical protein